MNTQIKKPRLYLTSITTWLVETIILVVIILFSANTQTPSPAEAHSTWLFIAIAEPTLFVLTIIVVWTLANRKALQIGPENPTAKSD